MSHQHGIRRSEVGEVSGSVQPESGRGEVHTKFVGAGFAATVFPAHCK
jgi:hypothetical protein